MDADEVGYREALRVYCRTGRDEALRIRKGGGVRIPHDCYKVGDVVKASTKRKA